MTNNNEQTDIFELFGIVDEHAEKQKKEEAARKAKLEEIRKKAAEAKPSRSAETPAKKAADEFTPNEDTIIRYYGESIAITSYFSPEELAEGILIKKKDEETERKPLEPEMLRKRMEKDFPELVKQHTEIIFIKTKNIIVPTMKAKKKGCSKGVLSSDSTSLLPSKIPFAILQDFIAIAKLYGEIDLEIHGDIYFHIKEQRYLLDIPKQSVHRLWTEVTEDSLSIAERIQQYAIKVAEIHSHHSMPPHPSRQDDESERLPSMHYVIIGHIEQYLPSIYVRKFISDEIGHVQKKVESLFECPFQNPPDFDIERIEVYGQ